MEIHESTHSVKPCYNFFFCCLRVKSCYYLNFFFCCLSVKSCYQLNFFFCCVSVKSCYFLNFFFWCLSIKSRYYLNFFFRCLSTCTTFSSSALAPSISIFSHIQDLLTRDLQGRCQECWQAIIQSRRCTAAKSIWCLFWFNKNRTPHALSIARSGGGCFFLACKDHGTVPLLFKFKPRSTHMHQFHSFRPRITSPRLNELRHLRMSNPWWAACVLLSLMASHTMPGQLDQPTLTLLSQRCTNTHTHTHIYIYLSLALSLSLCAWENRYSYIFFYIEN